MMYYTANLTDFFDALDKIIYPSYAKPQATTCNKQPCNDPQPQDSGYDVYECPEIQRATFNGNTTIVWFKDGTKCTVECSTGDKYDRKTAIAYAMVKRMLGKVGKFDKNRKQFMPNDIDGNGFGCYLQKIVDAGFDQKLEEKLASEKKHNARAEHEARQAAQKKAAFEKRVEERAKQILLERAAMDRANEIEDTARNKSCNKTCDKTCTCKSSDPKAYVKPNKPFSKFTLAEKREYWRAHNALRKNKSNKK